jgi:hypothetical protein
VQSTPPGLATPAANRAIPSPSTRVSSVIDSSGSPESKNSLSARYASRSSSPNTRSPGPGSGQPQRAPQGDHPIDLEAGALRHLRRRVPGSELPLEREQHEPVLGDRRPQLLESDPLGGQTLEQLEPSRPLITVEPVEQPRAGKVHAAILSHLRRGKPAAGTIG